MNFTRTSHQTVKLPLLTITGHHPKRGGEVLCVTGSDLDADLQVSASWRELLRVRVSFFNFNLSRHRRLGIAGKRIVH
jgi:hypothetical protein